MDRLLTVIQRLVIVLEPRHDDIPYLQIKKINNVI